ncbi:unnamed protein product [Symbiodinium natans]|uniref:Uncharacterized protein n=1 Tax=Symbiodinium natans TaxID=878477 RepID=A0A812TSQ3_9DINO|nr:unnamed protein product [Symbiodinium natans]
MRYLLARSSLLGRRAGSHALRPYLPVWVRCKLARFMLLGCPAALLKRLHAACLHALLGLALENTRSLGALRGFALCKCGHAACLRALRSLGGLLGLVLYAL